MAVVNKEVVNLNKRKLILTFLKGEKMKSPRIIKRYQNRKLYDTHKSCYVTLEEIAEIIRDGNEIKVLDNKTKKDITYSTQIQLLFDQEKKFNKIENTEMLKRVIRSESGVLTGYIKSLEAKLNIANHSLEEKMAEVLEEENNFNNNNLSQRPNLETFETPNTLN